MTTLYILDQGSVVALNDSRLLVKKGKDLLQDVPINHLKQIIIFGNAVLTTQVVKVLLDRGIDVAYLSQSGVYRGRLQPAISQDIRLREAQYLRAADQSFCQKVSQSFVQGKTVNMLTLLKRQKSQAAITEQIKRLSQSIPRIVACSDLDELRGHEGAATAAYFRALSRLLNPDWNFERREHHPPKDPVNVLLSLGYTLLHNQILTLLNLIGFDPYRGFYHQPKPGHACLSSDLMEEWRPLIVDSLVLRMINRNEIRLDDFTRAKGNVRLEIVGLKKFLIQFDRIMEQPIFHPVAQQRLTYRNSLEYQARQFAHVVLGKGKSYAPIKFQ